MEMKKMSDQNLLNDTKTLAEQERTMTAKLVKYLAEIGRRKLYVERGFGSLYAYCIGELKMSEGQANRRIAAARLLQEMPQLEQKIANGQLNVSGLTKISGYFKDQKTPPREKEKIIEKTEGKSARQIDQLAMGLWGEDAVKPIEKAKPVSQTQVQLTVTLDQETFDLLTQLRKDLVRKGVKDMAGVIKELCKKEIENSKIKKDQSKKPQALRSNPAEPQSRHIPLPIRRQVYERAQYKCEHFTVATPEASPKVCGSTENLEIDHMRSWVSGGSHELSNLRLLCRAHHARETFKMFGQAPQVPRRWKSS